MSPLLNEYLDHILNEIQFIRNVTENLTFDEFLADERTKRAIIRSLEIIGEATKRIPSCYCRKHSAVPWKSISGMRDRLIHGYFVIDYDIVWDVISNKLQSLRDTIESIRKEAEPDA